MVTAKPCPNLTNDIEALLSKIGPAQKKAEVTEMRDMVLIADRKFNLSEIKDRINPGDFEITTAGDRISIQDVSTRNFVQIERDDNIALYYDDEEDDVFKSSISDPAYYIVNFQDIDLLKRILEMALDRPDVFLDNDFGLIQTGQQFVLTLDRQPKWDWAMG
ncbi:hypothetical protein GCM10025794_01450 [Massilia kyonggiensis]